MRAVSLALLSWFDPSARAMDWRETRDPYRIWVSEVMLQQTTVAAVLPFYRRFIDAFPSMTDLARAPAGRVMKLWEGLGYYSRARNLHKSARILVEEHGGRLPRTVGELMALPGVGRSTAGAIAAIAFRKDAPILDGNARRVLARLLSIRENIRRPSVERTLWEMSRRLILPGKGKETALALMDLGNLVCTPKNPACPHCPLGRHCLAYREGVAGTIPFRPPGKRLPHHEVVVAVIFDARGMIFIDRRPEEGLLGGLWEFPGGKIKTREAPESAVAREASEKTGLEVDIAGRIGAIRHSYSHYRVTIHAFRCRKRAGRVRAPGEWRWVRPGDLDKYAFPASHRRIIPGMIRGFVFRREPPREGG